MPTTHSNAIAQASQDLWQQQFSADNSAQLERLQEKMLYALDDTLIPRQRQLLIMYFFRSMTVTQIAQELKIGKPCVSRTLTRALEKLGKALRYSL